MAPLDYLLLDDDQQGVRTSQFLSTNLLIKLQAWRRATKWTRTRPARSIA